MESFRSPIPSHGLAPCFGPSRSAFVVPSVQAALEEERQLGQREREVMAERLRFAQSEDEASRAPLAARRWFRSIADGEDGRAGHLDVEVK